VVSFGCSLEPDKITDGIVHGKKNGKDGEHNGKYGEIPSYQLVELYSSEHTHQDNKNHLKRQAGIPGILI
jgi:hypothetical protein